MFTKKGFLLCNFVVGLLFSLSFASVGQAALIPTAPTLSIGGRTYTDLSSNLKILCNNLGVGTYSPLKTYAGTVYQVPAGKTLTVTSGVMRVFESWGGNNMQLGYSTAASADGAGGAPTGAVPIPGGVMTQPSGAGKFEFIVANLVVPANDYLYAQGSSGSTNGMGLCVIGYEQ